MLSTGIWTPLGLKIADPRTIEEIGARVEALLPTLQGTRSAFAQRTQTGYFLDIDREPEELARANGLTIEQAQQVFETAV